MSRVVAVAGLGDETPKPNGGAMLAWGVVIGITVSIFVGTLMLNPTRKRRA